MVVDHSMDGKTEQSLIKWLVTINIWIYRTKQNSKTNNQKCLRVLGRSSVEAVAIIPRYQPLVEDPSTTTFMCTRLLLVRLVFFPQASLYRILPYQCRCKWECASAPLPSVSGNPHHQQTVKNSHRGTHSDATLSLTTGLNS